MGIFKKKKIKNTEFVQDPEAFIQFLRNENPEIIAFGIESLTAAGPGILESMMKLLLDEGEERVVRYRAGQVLSRIGAPAVFPLLAALEKINMSDPAAGVSLGIIASALGGMGVDVIDPLIRTLNSASRAARYGAAIALVQTANPKAIQALQDAAERGNANDRAIFNQVLGKKG